MLGTVLGMRDTVMDKTDPVLLRAYSLAGEADNQSQIKSYMCLCNKPPVYCKLLKGKY